MADGECQRLSQVRRVLTWVAITHIYSHMAIHYEQPLDLTFRALGDGTRRQILSALALNGACTATELGAPFEVAQPTVSKHLKVLERAGLVKRNVAGRTHRFELVVGPMDEAVDWIVDHKAFWKGTLERLEEFLGGVEKSVSNL